MFKWVGEGGGYLQMMPWEHEAMYAHPVNILTLRCAVHDIYTIMFLVPQLHAY